MGAEGREGSTAQLIMALTTALDCLSSILKKEVPIAKGESTIATSGQDKANKSDGSPRPTEVKAGQLGHRTGKEDSTIDEYFDKEGIAGGVAQRKSRSLEFPHEGLGE